jgi:cell division protein FtsB
MILSSPGRRALANAVYSLVMLGLIAYFGFAALQGEYGFTRLIEVRAIEGALESDLAAMRSERAALENRVRRLSDDYLDLDLLDEQARKMLGYARPDEMIIR